MIEWVVDKPGVRLGLGDSVNYDGDADLVFTHLYGPLPKQLIGKPAIVNLYGNKREAAERWCGAELVEVSKWGRGLTNTVYVANIDAGPAALRCHWEAALPDFRDLQEDADGWFPDELCMRCLRAWGGGMLPVTVFDGFMGRGSVGRACAQLGLNFVGIDRNPDRVEMAAEYLGC